MATQTQPPIPDERKSETTEEGPYELVARRLAQLRRGALSRQGEFKDEKVVIAAKEDSD